MIDRLSRLIRPLLRHDPAKGHFEQRNVNGYVTQKWVQDDRPAKVDTPAASTYQPGMSRGPGTKVNSAAAAYMASLRLEPSHMDCNYDTSIQCS